MAEVSSVQAALEAFRRRDKRFVLTGATLAYLAGSFALGAAFLALAWPALSGAMTWYFGTVRTVLAGGEPASPSAEIFRLAPWYGGYAILALVWFAAYEAACLRWLVRGERGGVFGLSFGADTWRVLTTYIVWLGLWVGFCVVTGATFGILAGVSGAAPGFRVVAMLIGALTPLALAALLIWIATRLSPAAAASIAARKFAFFDAWKATRGHFWETLGAFVIVLAVYIAIASVLSALIRWPVSHAIYPVMTEAMGEVSFDAVLDRMGEVFASPLLLGVLAAYAIVSIVLACLFRLAWFGVNAHIVRLAIDTANPPGASPSA